MPCVTPDIHISIISHIYMNDEEEKEKIPLSVVRKLPYKTLNRMINKAKAHLKTDKVWQDICKEYDEDVDIIDYIPTIFGNLDVSAKTNKGIVTLNYKLLCDGDFNHDISYLIHEYTHWFQQCYGKKATQSSDDGSYLHNKFEQEGFTNQVEYIAKQHGEDEAEEYVDDLLEHHEVDDKKEKKKLENIFMKQV
jgi:hypothetical protein